MYINVKTEASILKSTIRDETLVSFLKEQQMRACAVTNNNLYGFINRRNLFQENGLKLVPALSFELDTKDKLPLQVYAMNEKGYKNLIKLSSAVKMSETGKCSSTTFNAYSEGLKAVIPHYLGDWHRYSSLTWILSTFGEGNVYLAVNRTNGEILQIEELTQKVAAGNNMPIIATHHSYFAKQELASAYQMVRGIDAGSMGHLTEDERNSYMPTQEQMTQWFIDKPLWLENARQLIEESKIDYPEKQFQMPQFPLNEGKKDSEVLRELAIAGLKVRLYGAVSGQIPAEYMERLDYEISVINGMGFASYFLMVSDFINFCRKEGILTGPGRGSSASSLVAYSLYITNVDPLMYNLLFERFLNPERISMPDIDVDILDTRRMEVVKYFENKYGSEYVAQIITFGKLTMKAAARDTGRMLQVDPTDLKLMSTLLNRTRKTTLRDAYESSQTLRDFVSSSDRNKQWFNLSYQIEGLTRNTSTHAAGVILTPKPLIEYVPVEKGSETKHITQWDMNEVESQGVLKMDFLGLSTLRLIDDILISLEKTYGIKPTLHTIPLDDRATYELLQKGTVEGIFQLESEGMRTALMSVVPTSINDIIAVNALYRPGPMEFIPDYAARKKGESPVEYPDASLENILSETYGIIIFQEQILLIAQQYAGYSLGQADLLRRAIGKKKRDVLEAQQSQFVEGAVKQGHTAENATAIFEVIVKFAEYGFPKSHSTAYSIITYQMAYLKANYPSHFYTALLNKTTGNATKIKTILSEMKQAGVVILPVDVKASSYKCKPEQGKVRLGYSIVSGVSTSSAETIKNATNRAATFKEFKFVINISKYETEISSLIKVGAFDSSYGPDRNSLLAEMTIGATDDLSLFFAEEPTDKVVESVSNYDLEMNVLGFSLQQHPVEAFRANGYEQRISNLVENSEVQVIGLIEEVKMTMTKKKEEMAFVKLTDETGTVSLTVFPRVYAANKVKLNKGQLIQITGKVEVKYKKTSIIVNKITA
ncbi:MAG: DNA polymerase III subunit alpha [Psychrobacillus sp.]